MTQAAAREKTPNAPAESKADDRVLRMVRRFPATPDKVFRAFTDPKRMARWWGPKGYTVPVCQLDARPGGKWLTTMRDPAGGEHTVSGVYKEIEAPSRLVFTWAWHEEGKRGHETVVEIALKAHGVGTEMTVTQQRFENAHDREMHQQGWSSALDCLAESLRG